jgi:hypothetical protein
MTVKETSKWSEMAKNKTCRMPGTSYDSDSHFRDFAWRLSLDERPQILPSHGLCHELTVCLVACSSVGGQRGFRGFIAIGRFYLSITGFWRLSGLSHTFLFWQLEFLVKPKMG